MKSIKILDTDEKSEYVVLTNFMGYEIDKEDHVLQIHRYTDGDDLFYNIQLKAWGFFESDTPNPLMPTQHGLFADAYSIVEEKMEEFLADDDESILDISEYVDQDVMMRGDDEETSTPDCCSVDLTPLFYQDEEEEEKAFDEDAYIETLDLGEYLAWLTKTGKMESILKDLGRVAKCHKQEEDTRDDCGGYFSTRYFCPQCYKGKCNYIGECYGKGQRPY